MPQKKFEPPSHEERQDLQEHLLGDLGVLAVNLLLLTVICVNLYLHKRKDFSTTLFYSNTAFVTYRSL